MAAKKPEVSAEILRTWVPVCAKLEEVEVYNKKLAKRYKRKAAFTLADVLLRPRGPGYKEVSLLASAVKYAPRAFTGASRKRKDDLILIPRCVAEYLAEKATDCAWKNDRTIQKDIEGEDA